MVYIFCLSDDFKISDILNLSFEYFFKIFCFSFKWTCDIDIGVVLLSDV